jgi:methionine sulfoxide reductase heme-binding subunit
MLAAKVSVFVLCFLPLARLFVLGYTENLTANPLEFITRSTGTWALVMLCVTLAVTPLRRITKFHQLARLRRMLGLFAFFYACLHLLCFVWFDHWFDLVAIIKDVIKRPFVTLGFAAFVLMLPLAVTSTNAMMKRLGRRWITLHRLVYLVAVLAVVHYWWLVKRDLTEPILYALVLALLFIARWRRAPKAADRSNAGPENQLRRAP